MNNTFGNDTLLELKSNGVVKRAGCDASDSENNMVEYDKTEEVKKQSKNEYFKKIKETFDLDLLKDGVYLNIVIGLSLYYVAESNFKLMTPFFLTSIGK